MRIEHGSTLTRTPMCRLRLQYGSIRGDLNELLPLVVCMGYGRPGGGDNRSVVYMDAGEKVGVEAKAEMAKTIQAHKSLVFAFVSFEDAVAAYRALAEFAGLPIAGARP